MTRIGLEARTLEVEDQAIIPGHRGSLYQPAEPAIIRQTISRIIFECGEEINELKRGDYLAVSLQVEAVEEIRTHYNTVEVDVEIHSLEYDGHTGVIDTRLEVEWEGITPLQSLH